MARKGQQLTADYINGMTQATQQRGTLSQLGQGANTESMDAGGGSTAVAGVRQYVAVGMFPVKLTKVSGAQGTSLSLIHISEPTRPY